MVFTSWEQRQLREIEAHLVADDPRWADQFTARERPARPVRERPVQERPAKERPAPRSPAQERPGSRRRVAWLARPLLFVLWVVTLAVGCALKCAPLVLAGLVVMLWGRAVVLMVRCFRKN
ncbi:DUF3040 domain-containing protein [Streptomyces anandii]|uniref:DUF3040 domain-containing protein n=1 Tax=Streptomyces anandii TaxID=285454 RepID=A0ABW6HAS7_9ACTN